MGTQIITYSYTDLNACSNAATRNAIVIDCNVTGILQDHVKANLLVYPNPNSGILNINYTKVLGMIRIYNAIGAMVYEERSEDIETTINTGAFSAGVYTLEVLGTYIKIIKQ